jgi:hypothetical protein
MYFKVAPLTNFVLSSFGPGDLKVFKLLLVLARMQLLANKKGCALLIR